MVHKSLPPYALPLWPFAPPWRLSACCVENRSESTMLAIVSTPPTIAHVLWNMVSFAQRGRRAW